MGEGIITGSVDEFAFEVEFMSCETDKADNLKVIDSDSHFSDFVGVHPSKIKQGKLFLHDIIDPMDREKVMKQICKKNSPYVYFDLYIKNKNNEYVYVHCSGHNVLNSTVCRLTFADVSRSAQKSEMLKKRADALGSLIDLVGVGICLFKVNKDMHFEALYINEECCRLFGTAKERFINKAYRIDELIHPEDKSIVFQAIGNAMATKKPIDMEMRVITHKDSFIWCKFTAAINRYDEDGCPVFHAVFSDITRLMSK